MLGRRGVVVGVTTLVWLATVAAASAAATLHVTSSADDGSAGTLRSVIGSAGDGDTVVIDPGVNPHLTAGNGGITINASQFGSLTIVGQGARSTTITGTGADSTFTLNDDDESNLAPVVTMSGVALTGGGGTDGGAVLVSANTSATLSAVTLFANGVPTNRGTALGGAVDAAGVLNLDDVTAVGNTVSPDGDGGAIYVTGGTAHINNSTITGNAAGILGGGVYNQGQAFLVGDTLAGNTDRATVQAANIGHQHRQQRHDDGRSPTPS